MTKASRSLGPRSKERPHSIVGEAERCRRGRGGDGRESVIVNGALHISESMIDPLGSRNVE
jgi:hypothetical protein